MTTRLSFGKSLLILLAMLVLYGTWDIAKTLYWKSRVTAMCLEDGGNTVFEKVVVPKEEYERFSTNGGNFNVPWDADRGYEEHPYKYRWEMIPIRSSSPTVSKSVGVTYRVADGRDLGIHVNYLMSSASLLAFLADFSFSCNSIPGFVGQGLTEMIFTKGE